MQLPFVSNKSSIRIVFSLAQILLYSVILNFFQVMLYVLIRPFHRALFKRLVAEVVQAPWVDLVASIFPKVDLVVSGEVPTDVSKPCIILANHQIDADSWYLWQLGRIQNNAGGIKIVLKDELKQIPVLGWAMNLFDFIFLKREKEVDIKKIRSQMKEFDIDNFAAWIMLFPEGTTVNTEFITKSRDFAKRVDRPLLHKTLLPRSVGLETLLEATGGIKPDIYDITMCYGGYSGEVPTYEMEYSRNVDTDIPSVKCLMAQDVSPNAAVHMRGKKFDFDEVYGNVEGWLDDRWVEKEKVLKDFVKTQSLGNNNNDGGVTTVKNGSTVLKFWLSVASACVVLPVMLFLGFPAYILWITYRVSTGAYGFGKNIWLPYVKDLVSEKKQRLLARKIKK